MRNSILLFLFCWVCAGIVSGETPPPNGINSKADLTGFNDDNQTSFSRVKTFHGRSQCFDYLDSFKESAKNIDAKPKAVSFYSFRHTPKFIASVTLIKSSAGWEKFWSRIEGKSPKAPTDFKEQMVLECVRGNLMEVIYRQKDTVVVLQYGPGHGGMKRDWSKWQPPPPQMTGFFLKKTDLPIRLVETYVVAK